MLNIIKRFTKTNTVKINHNLSRKMGPTPLIDEDMDEFLISDKFTYTVEDRFC